MWLHLGVVHLLINMLCLVIIGICLEQEFGFGKSSYILPSTSTYCLWINYSILHPALLKLIKTSDPFQSHLQLPYPWCW
jgi:membrane associated rhomboid family serine protease